MLGFLVEITDQTGMMIGFGRLWSNPPGSWLKIAVQKVVVGILRIGCSLARFVDPRSQALRPLPRGPRTSSKFSWRFAITHGSGLFVLIWVLFSFTRGPILFVLGV